METLWPRIEALLPGVSKPARYIGGEQGAVDPEHGPGHGGLAAALPRHLRDRAAQPGPPDPLRDPERAPRRAGRARLRALGRHGGRHAGGGGAALQRGAAPAGRGLRRARLQPLGRAGLHERAQPDRPGRRPGARGRPRRRRPARGGRRPLRLQPRAAGGLRRRLRPRRRRGGGRRDHRGDGGLAGGAPPEARDREALLRALAGARGRVRAGALRADLRGRAAGRRRSRDRRGPAEVAKRTVADLADWPYPAASWCR